jgi:hypothetical protein
MFGPKRGTEKNGKNYIVKSLHKMFGRLQGALCFNIAPTECLMGVPFLEIDYLSNPGLTEAREVSIDSIWIYPSINYTIWWN